MLNRMVSMATHYELPNNRDVPTKIQLEHEGSIDLPLFMYVAVCRILGCFIQ